MSWTHTWEVNHHVGHMVGECGRMVTILGENWLSVEVLERNLGLGKEGEMHKAKLKKKPHST